MNTWKGFTEERIGRLVLIDDTHLAISYQSENGRLGKRIRIINWISGGLFAKLEGHTLDVCSLANIGVDSLLASGSLDKTIKIWHWPTNRLVKNLTGSK
jgi:WD40 repeat protein